MSDELIGGFQSTLDDIVCAGVTCWYAASCIMGGYSSSEDVQIAGFMTAGINSVILIKYCHLYSRIKEQIASFGWSEELFSEPRDFRIALRHFARRNQMQAHYELCKERWEAEEL